MDPKPPQIPPTPEQGPKILSFEEFSYRGESRNRPPEYSNLYLYFTDTPASEIRRKRNYYIEFAKARPDLDTSLCAGIQELVKSQRLRIEGLKVFDQNLYEAYKIMRVHGASDNDLFA